MCIHPVTNLLFLFINWCVCEGEDGFGGLTLRRAARWTWTNITTVNQNAGNGVQYLFYYYLFLLVLFISVPFPCAVDQHEFSSIYNRLILDRWMTDETSSLDHEAMNTLVRRQ